MGFDVRSRYLKKTDSKDYTRLENMDLSLERDKERDRYIRMQAIELAKQRSRSNEPAETMTDIRQANAGNDRTTAMRQNTNPYGLPVYKGLNTAENGADVNQNKFKTEAATQNGYKGLIGTKSQEQTISKEQSLAHANEVYAPFKDNQEVTDLFNQYVDASDRLETDRMTGNSGYSKYRSVRAKQKLEKQIRDITGLSADDFKQVAENYTYLRHDEQRTEQQAELDEASGLKKAALTAVNIPTAAIGNYYAALGSLKKPNDPELGRDYNSAEFYLSNLNKDTKEAVHTDIDESTMADYQKALAGFGYDAFTMGTESAASQLLGGAGLASFFAGGYASSLEEAEQRGLTRGQAQGYALVSGGLEYATEKLPWKNLKDIYSGKAIGKEAVKGSLLPYVKALFKQAGEEAGEEVINGVGDVLADALINTDKSKINIAIDNYMAQGLSEEEATRKAFFEEGKDILYAAASAAVSAGASAGPAFTVQAYETTKAGRNLADYENKTGNLTRNVENENYIPETKENYVADEDYRQAQETRQAILAASEKAAKGERISGREARALAESYSKTAKNMNTAREANYQNQLEKENRIPEKNEYEPKTKSYEQIKEDIEFASTPYQLAQAIESITEETDELRELIDYKKSELEMYNFKAEEVENAVTAKKAYEMGQKGEEVTKEQLEKIPVQDRQKVLEANNSAYNKQVLKEHPDAVVDKTTGKYFAPSEVKVEGADIVVVDTEGNVHTEYENPRINQVMNIVTQTSKDTRGHATDQSIYDTNVQQAAYAIELAINSPEATSALVRTAVESIFNNASIGHKSWAEYEKSSKGLFTKVDAKVAEKLYNSIREQARKSDSAKTKNVEGKKTSDKVVSDTLRENLDAETVALLEALGNKIGYNFVASTNPNARGSIVPGSRQIAIGSNSLDELWSIKSHEAIAEYLQAHGNEEDVLAIQDDMLKYLENKLGTVKFNDLINQYQSVYRSNAKKGTVDEGKSRRAAANEMFNDTVFALISSEEGVKDYINWIKENNTAAEQVSFFQKVKDFFSKIFDYVSNYIQTGNFNAAEKAALEMDAKTAKEFRDRLFKLMDDAIENAKATEGIQGESAARNSITFSDVQLDQDGIPVIQSKIFTKSQIKNFRQLNYLIKDELQKLIGNKYTIKSDGRDVYIAGDFAAEYTGSNDTWNNKESIRVAKANAISGIEQIITTAVNPKWSKNTEAKHNIDAKRGWTYYETEFGIKTQTGINYYSAVVNVRMDEDGKDYVYDITDIKKRNVLHTQGVSTQNIPSNVSLSSSTKNATTDNSESVENIENTARNSFAGIGAETADMHQLNIASDMMDDGIDEETILASTGWFKGLDNKWKFEIPDNDLVIFKDGNAKFLYGNPDFKRYNELMDKIFFKGDVYTDEEFEELGELEEKVLLKTQDYGNLSDFIKHDKLFDAYPFLYGTYVDFVDFGDASIKGAADIKNNGIHLNEQFHKSVSGSYSSDAMKSVLLHEIQHLIQQYEDFANGSSPTWWNDIKEERIEADEKNLAAAKEYLDRAIADARERGLPTSVEDYIFELSEQLDSNELTPEEYRKEIAKFKKSKVYHYSDMVRKLERHLRRLRNDSNELLYWNTAGEIEARDVQNRMSLTEQERREKLPKNYDSDVVYTDGSTAQRRYSIKVDTEGRSLSKGQQEYFKDSKVVDEEGRLRVVYHGTMAAFNIFDLKEARDTEDIEAFFFSGDIEEAEGYGNLGEYYLNITNPADYDTAYDIFFKYKGKEHAGRLTREELQSMGYDGVIAIDEDSPEYTEYLAFNSNQIKKVDNLNPTDNPDIRKSIKVDDQGREIAPKMAEYLKDNADVFFDENGAVKNYYHGTRYAGFTQFSLFMMDDKQSIFLTDNKGTANTYAGNHDLFEPDKEWTYNQLENAISYMTGGDWEVDKDGDTITITEYGFGDKEDKETQFDSVLAAQTYFIDNYLNKIDLKSDENAAIYNLYVKSSNPLVIDANGDNWDQIIPKKYFRHYIDVNITKTDEQYSAEWADERGVYYNHTFDSKEKLEQLLAKLPEDVPQEGLYFENLYIDENRDIIPSNTRTMAKYAKENGYDSLVVNNVVDTGIYGNNEEKLTPSQVVVVFDPNQVKSVYNENPTSDEDIRKSIKVDWDTHTTYKLPDRTYEDDIFFNGTDEEIEAAEKQEIKAKAYVANIIHSKDFAGLMFKDSIGLDRLLTRSTRKDWDWQLTESRDGEPIGHENYKEENDDITSYDTWPSKTMAALYNEIVNELPMKDAVIYVIREGIADDFRNSIKVYGEASPYADSLNETKVIQTMIGTMNNALSKADAFAISNEELIRIENYITNKYKVEGLEDGEIAANIAYAFAHMQQNKLDSDYENMMNYLLNIGDEIINKSNMIDPASKELYDQARQVVASKKFKLSDEERAEISNAFGGSWKSAFGAMQKAGIKLDNKNGTDIDRVYSEIRDELLKAAGVDISEADKPSQQILSIIDTMTALEPTAYLWDGANDMDKALTVVSDIVDQYYSIATEQLEKNIAKGTKKGNEKIKKAIDTEKAKLRGQWAKYKQEKSEEFNSIVAEKNQIIQQQQNQLRQQWEQMKQWDKDAKETARQTILNEKQMRATAKLQAQQAVQNYKEREERARQIENIKKTGIRLIKWLDNPTEKQHIPIFLQKPLGEFLAAIDFLPTNAKADSKSTLSWHQRMQDLRDVLVRIKDAEADGDNSPEAYFAQNMLAKDILNMMDEFLGKESWDEFTQSYITTKREAKKVSLLDAKELATLNNIMSALSASINNMNKTLANQFYSDMDALAAESFKELKELKKNKNKLNLVAHYLKDFALSEKTPVYFFEELGKGAKSVFDELRQGWNIRTEHIRDASEHMQKFKKENGIDDKDISKWSNHLNTFDLSEGTIELSDAQIMSLYRTVNRTQGRPHVMLGGIRPSDTKLKTKYLHYSKALHINYGDYLKIISVLSDKQILMADEMTRYMSKECSKWGNRTFEKMFGYRKFTEDDYFPLKTDAYSRGVTNASDNNVAYNTLKNGSATKNIVPNANNAVMLDDIFDVFASHVDFMASYDGFVMPIADAMRWFNYSQKVMTGTEEGTRVDVVANMQEALDSVLGKAGNEYFRTFIKNINGIYEGKGGNIQLLDLIASNYKAQAVMANLRVVAQQPMAIARATDRIEDRYILKAAALPAATLGIAANKWAKKAQKNSSLAYWKAQGYYETMIGQSLKSIITGDQSFKDKVNEIGGALAGKADDITWGVIYRAAELKVSKTRPDLEYDSKEYTKEVVKVFEDIIDHTQVIDTIFHKSQVMRSANPVAKMATSFMAEPTLTANIAAHRIWEAQRALGNGDKKEAAKIIGKLLRVLITNSLMVSLAQSLFDALRDDDVDKDFLEKMLYYEFGISDEMTIKDVALSNFVDNLNPLNWIPVTKEIMSYIQGYDASNMYVDGIYSALDTVSELVKFASGKSTKTMYGDIYTVAKGVSQLFGIPISNAVREVRTLHNNINDLWGGKDWLTTQAAEKKLEKKIETNRLNEVFNENDLKKEEAEVTAVYEKAIENGKAEKDAWSDARSMLKEQFQRQVAEHPEEKANYINRYATLLSKTKHSKKGTFINYTDKEAKAYMKTYNWYEE